MSEHVSTDRDPRVGAPGARGAFSLVLSPRWIAWHLLTLGAMVTCGLLAAWQWRRAGSALGSAVNVGYGLQWPVFAAFFGWMWWRMLRMELHRLRETSTAPPSTVRPADAGSRETASLETASSGTGSVDTAHVGTGRVDGARSRMSPARVSPAPPDGSSPFVHRPGRVRQATDVDDPELAEYNRMLAALAARGRKPQD